MRPAGDAFSRLFHLPAGDLAVILPVVEPAGEIAGQAATLPVPSTQDHEQFSDSED